MDENEIPVEVETDEGGAAITSELILDSCGFEFFEIEKEAPYLDYASNFASYMAETAIADIFGIDFDWGDKVNQAVADEIEARCSAFIDAVLSPALEKLGGWQWFDVAAISCSYDVLDGSMSFSIDDLRKSDAEHPAAAATKFASHKKALDGDGETEIEVKGEDVKAAEEADEGEGDLAEWIFDAIINNLAFAGRGGVDATALDQIADKAAETCDQDPSKFESLKFAVKDDGSISGFDFNGNRYDLNL